MFRWIVFTEWNTDYLTPRIIEQVVDLSNIFCTDHPTARVNRNFFLVLLMSDNPCSTVFLSWNISLLVFVAIIVVLFHRHCCCCLTSFASGRHGRSVGEFSLNRLPLPGVFRTVAVCVGVISCSSTEAANMPAK